MTDFVYENKYYTVEVGSPSRGGEGDVYKVINKLHLVVEHEAPMLAECIEAANFFVEKLDALEDGPSRIVTNGPPKLVS